LPAFIRLIREPPAVRRERSMHFMTASAPAETAYDRRKRKRPDVDSARGSDRRAHRRCTPSADQSEAKDAPASDASRPRRCCRRHAWFSCGNPSRLA
jgi:hypothetical protein